MKASELIKQLQDCINNNGDFDCEAINKATNGQYFDVCEIKADKDMIYIYYDGMDNFGW